MNKRKKYAEPQKVANKEREKQYIEKVISNYGEVESYFYDDLMPRIEELRREIARIRMTSGLDDLESEYNVLYKEYLEFAEMDEKLYENVYDTYYGSFEATLTDAQIEILLPVVNEYVFSDLQTVESMREWLECRNQEPVKVKDIAELCYLLNLLRDNGYICGNAQTVAEKNKTFVGGRGNPITQRSLTASVYKKRDKDEIGRYDTNQILNQEIKDTVEALGGVKV